MSLLGWVTTEIIAWGYVGVLFFMIAESIILPLPSEAILPFAGFLSSMGGLNLWLVALVATIGSLIGSTGSYLVGKHGGRPFLLKYGKFFLFDEKKLALSDRFFAKHGDRAVFFGRLLPVVRHFISIPAGISRMGWKPFLLYTATGAFLWNLLLTYAGFALGASYSDITTYTAPIEAVLVGIVILVILWYVVEAIEKRTQFMRKMAESESVKSARKHFDRVTGKKR